MSMPNNIINLIYSAYCIVTFFIILLLLMMVYAAVYFMPDRARTLAAYKANRILSWIWLKICGYRIAVEGWEKIDPRRAYMFVGNHTNMLDLPITGYFLQHYYKSLVKKELSRVPIFGFLIKVSSVKVDRSNMESRRRSTQIIVDKLKSGVSFLIFPEGTRNKTDKPLKSFYSGAFKTAVLAHVPVVPMVYLDHRLLQPVDSYRFYPGSIRVKILDPIETSDMSYDQSGMLKDRIYAEIEATMLEEDKNFENK